MPSPAHLKFNDPAPDLELQHGKLVRVVDTKKEILELAGGTMKHHQKHPKSTGLRMFLIC